MHDFSLGAPVDMGEYCGPLLDGKPLHKGNCEDGVYGCRTCRAAARSLTDEQLKAIGRELTDECAWCHKEVPFQEMSGVRPWDERNCYYEICRACKKQYNDELDELDRTDPIYYDGEQH